MKQTAVQWLQQSLSLTFEQQMQFEGLFKQAKEMEKKQEGSYSEEDLKEAFQSGFTNGFNMNSVTFEQWFKQFKKR